MPTRVFIKRGILIKFLFFCLIDQTSGRNEFYINLDSLLGIFHLLIRLGYILGIRKFSNHNPLFLKKTVEAWNGVFISSLHELHPGNN